MKKESIRPLTKRDLATVARLDGPLFEHLQHHHDYALENTAALWQGEELLGVGCLKRHGSWYAAPGRKLLRKLTLSLHAPEALEPEEEERIRSLLMDALKARYEEIAAAQPEGIQVAMHAYVDAEDGPMLQLLVDNGFFLNAVLAVMGRDLDAPVPEPVLPSGLRVEELTLDETGMKAYLQADMQANAQSTPISPEEMRSFAKEDGFRCFVAMEGDAVAASVSCWHAGDGRSETEKVFVVPRWRRQGVAAALLCHALKALQAEGQDLATLTVRGTNRGAMALYTSLGYTLRFLLVETLYETDSGRKP